MQEETRPVGQDIKSRPIYAPVSLDSTGLRHLLVVDAASVPPEGLKDAPGAAAQAWPEVWVVSRDSRIQPTPKFMKLETEGAVHPFRSTAMLLDALKRRLARETMGFRLYAIGSETFLADVRAVGLTAGLTRAEMAFAHAGALSRRVWCVHCGAVTEGVTTSIFTCSGCGAKLFVRDHFSARLAAFMGVQADAETPGEHDAPETLYP